MNRKHWKGKCSLKRTVVSLLVLSLLCSVCISGLRVHAEEADVTEPTAYMDSLISEPSEESTNPSEEPTDLSQGTTQPSEQRTEPSEEPTDASEESMNATEPSSPDEPVETVDPVIELYNKLMSAATYEELDSMMGAMTTEEYQLLNQFTPEQTDALNALVTQLNENTVQIYPDYSNVRLVISDTVKTDGRLTVTAVDMPSDGDPVYTWYKNGLEVEREKVTGDFYNVDEYGAWINVALDDGSQETYTVRLTGTKVTDANGNITVEPVTDGAASASFTVPYFDSLQNGDFENPANSNTPTLADQWYLHRNPENLAQSQYIEGAPGLVWNTTSSCNSIEIINDNVNRDNGNGTFRLGETAGSHGVLKVAKGDQAAELNSEDDGALYQDVMTVPGSTMYWSLEHMSRPVFGGVNNPNFVGLNTNGVTDTMYVLIMPTTLAETAGNNQSEVDTQEEVATVMNNLAAYPGSYVRTITYKWRWEQGNYPGYGAASRMYRINADGSQTLIYTVTAEEATQHADPWVETNGSYVVPDGQYMTRYFFVAGPTQSGSTIGNHVDDIWFSTQVPPPNPGYANLTIEKTLVGVDDMTDEQLTEVKNSLSFAVSGAVNQTIGGSDMHWSGNVGTYTIQNIVLGSNTGYTVTETAGNIDGYTLTTQKDTDSGTLSDGGTSKAAFTNTYTPNSTFITLDKVVKGNMGDLNKEFTFTVAVNGTELSAAYTLNDGTPKITISDIPLNATVTITETNHGKYEVSAAVSNTESESVNGNVVTFTTSSLDGHDVVITNTYNATIDTGIVTESAPHILIFTMAVVGALVLLKKRKDYSVE